MIKITGRGSVTINGRTYLGNSVHIDGDKVTVDGVPQEPITDHPIQISGDAIEVSSESGMVTVYGNVTGNVKTMSGSVACEAIAGNVSTMSGQVKAASIGGHVSTMSGSILR